jgi:hypothetical protein
MTIYGVAHAGEEPGCVVLSATDNRVYALLGGDRQIITAGGQLAGDRARRGRPAQQPAVP